MGVVVLLPFRLSGWAAWSYTGRTSSPRWLGKQQFRCRMQSRTRFEKSLWFLWSDFHSLT